MLKELIFSFISHNGTLSGFSFFGSGAGFLAFFRLPATGHRTPFRYIIPFPAAQNFPAEITTGGRPFLIDSAAPLRNAAAIRLLFSQVPAWRIGKELAVCFLKTPLAEVVQLVGFALPDEGKREPATAFAAPAAGAGDRRDGMRFHISRFDRNGRKGNGSPDSFQDR
jgi:hypothetical protein